MKKVLIIGGAGFIGWHLVRNLISEGYIPIIGVRSSIPLLDSPAEILKIQLQTDSFSKLVELLKGIEIVIFMGGKDDRTIPEGEPYNFFYQENVIPCVRLVQAAEAASVAKVIILGSYFTYFNYTRPEWKMAEKHPYVRSRVAQQEESIKASSGKTAVIVLEIPYVFGATPHLIPLWKPLIQYIRLMPIIFYPTGGTNIISVQNVAEAIIGAMRYANHGNQLPIAGYNLTWKQMIAEIARVLGVKRKVISIPLWLLHPIGYIIKGIFWLMGKKTGLDIANFMKVQADYTYLDTETSTRTLHYQLEPLKTAFEDTVKASLNN